MNPEIKAKWVAALRSGAYAQGQGTLRDCDGRFCCLGVLCDLHAKETGAQWEKVTGGFYYDGNSDLQPPSVSRWAGLSTPKTKIPRVKIGHQIDSVAKLNDVGVSFAEIADAIEAQL